jgi:hypothetical protein
MSVGIGQMDDCAIARGSAGGTSVTFDGRVVSFTLLGAQGSAAGGGLVYQ